MERWRGWAAWREKREDGEGNEVVREGEDEVGAVEEEEGR